MKIQAMHPAGVSQPHPTVLVVDDEPLIRWCIGQTLTDDGYQVTEANDAASAIEAFGGDAPPSDVVLLDLWLPDSSDFGPLSSIRRLSAETPIILMTAHGTPELADEAMHRGAFAVLQKPFEMRDLAPLVRRALDARKP